MEVIDNEFLAWYSFCINCLLFSGMATGPGYLTSKVTCFHALWHCFVSRSVVNLGSSRPRVDGMKTSLMTLQSFTLVASE